MSGLKGVAIALATDAALAVPRIAPGPTAALARWRYGCSANP